MPLLRPDLDEARLLGAGANAAFLRISGTTSLCLLSRMISHRRLFAAALLSACDKERAGDGTNPAKPAEVELRAR